MDQEELRKLVEEKIRNSGLTLEDGLYQIHGDKDKLNYMSEDIELWKEGFNIEEVSLNEKRQIVKTLQSYNLENTSLELLKSDVNSLFTGVVKNVIPLAPRQIFRVRKNECENGQKLDFFKNISELKYPEPKYVKRRGRLNDVGQSLFYCSPKKDVAINECYIENGESFTLMVCELKDITKPLRFWLLGVSEEFYSRYFSPIDDPMSREMLRQELQLSKSSGIHEYIYNEFTKKVEKNAEHEYKSTIAISDIYLKAGDVGVAYPSIASGFEGVNLVMHPQTFEECLVPVKCILCVKEDDVIKQVFESKSINQITGDICWF